MTNLFLSQEFSQEYEVTFWNEIYGCVNYLSLPYDTVMNMPTYLRKFWIMKHNEQAKEMEKSNGYNNLYSSNDGTMLNAVAKMEQENIKNQGGA